MSVDSYLPFRFLAHEDIGKDETKTTDDFEMLTLCSEYFTGTKHLCLCSI